MAKSWYGYNSDDTTTFAVKLDSRIATQGGFSSVPKPPETMPWPWHSRDMRHVNGVNADGSKRARIPIADPSNGKYTNGGTFNNTLGESFTITGAEGERRPASHL